MKTVKMNVPRYQIPVPPPPAPPEPPIDFSPQGITKNPFVSEEFSQGLINSSSQLVNLLPIMLMMGMMGRGGGRGAPGNPGGMGGMFRGKGPSLPPQPWEKIFSGQKGDDVFTEAFYQKVLAKDLPAIALDNQFAKLMLGASGGRTSIPGLLQAYLGGSRYSPPGNKDVLQMLQRLFRDLNTSRPMTKGDLPIQGPWNLN